jgi:hypothetical protein
MTARLGDIAQSRGVEREGHFALILEPGTLAPICAGTFRDCADAGLSGTLEVRLMNSFPRPERNCLRPLAAMCVASFLMALLAGCGAQKTDPNATVQLEQEMQQLRATNQELQRLRAENQELPRLRREAEEAQRLRDQTKDVAQLRQENEQLRGQLQGLKSPRKP